MPGPAVPGAAAGPGSDPEESYDFLFKLVLIGDASVGKTCLVQRFKTGAFAERQGSTIGVDFTMKSLEIQGKRVKVSGAAARGRGSGPAARRCGRGAGGAGGEPWLTSRPGTAAGTPAGPPGPGPTAGGGGGSETVAGGERCRPCGVPRLGAAPAALAAARRGLACALLPRWEAGRLGPAPPSRTAPAGRGRPSTCRHSRSRGGLSCQPPAEPALR